MVAQLLVRNLDEDVKRRLQERAARRGHSMEEEVRDILARLGFRSLDEVLRAAAAALDDQPRAEPLGTRIARRFAGLGLREDLPELHGHAARPADLGGA